MADGFKNESVAYQAISRASQLPACHECGEESVRRCNVKGSFHRQQHEPFEQGISMCLL